MQLIAQLKRLLKMEKPKRQVTSQPLTLLGVTLEDRANLEVIYRGHDETIRLRVVKNKQTMQEFVIPLERAHDEGVVLHNVEIKMDF